MKDLVSAMCTKCGLVQGIFGTDKELFCKTCKTEEMKNIKHKMCEKCGEHQPSFNYKNIKKPRFCCACKLDGMTDVRNMKCISCGLFTVSNYKKTCAYCSPESSVRQKTKEMKVVKFLENAEIKFTHNKSVGFTCGNYKPDISIDAGSHFVIVEIDEDQHASYEANCELVRMQNIYNAIGMRCVFLRYNPDVFRVKGQVKRIDEESRLKILLEEVEKWRVTVPEEEITIFRLFYNNDTGNYIEKFYFCEE
jgi:hypothetical protein